MTMPGHCDNQNTGEGFPCAMRLSRGLKVRLSVVLGRATRVCANHITGITCGGVVVSSDVFDCPLVSAQDLVRCVLCISEVSLAKELPVAAIRVSALTVFVTRAGKASRK